MDLISLIMNAGNGLSVFRAQAATASHNIANSDTPGYSRQEAVATESLPSEPAGLHGYIGRGVSLKYVVQSRDQFIETQLNAASTNSANTSAHADALNTVSALNVGATGGVTDAMGKFYSSLRDLAQNPGDLALRRSVVDTAKALSGSFNRTASSLNAARTAIDSDMFTLTNQVNGKLEALADLNRRIALAVNSGRTPNDLLDVRQNTLDDLAKMIGVRPVPDAYGNVSLVLPSGTSLVSNVNFNKLTLQANSTNRGHYDIVYAPADGSAPRALDRSELSGQMGGLLDARDSSIANAESDLDKLAFELSGAINAVHMSGFALDGTDGHLMFKDLTQEEGAATSMDVDADLQTDPRLLATAGTSTSGSGDPANIQKLVDTERFNLSNGLDAQTTFAKITSDFGTHMTTVKDASEFDKNLLDDLVGARESVSGVSVDEELIKLTKSQNAYNSMLKVIQTTTEMLDTLMNAIK